MWISAAEEKEGEIQHGELLFGFGMGKWEAGEGTGIEFVMGKDSDLLVLRNEDGSKKVASLQEHLQDLRSQGKEGTVAYHVISPLVDETGRVCPNRVDIKRQKLTRFVPKPTELHDRLAKNKPYSPAEICNVYNQDDLVSLMQSPFINVAFEVAMIPGRVASQVVLRPTQPKVITISKLTIPKGKAVGVACS